MVEKEHKTINEIFIENEDFINNEEDVKIKVLLPYLEYLGYNQNDLNFEYSIKVKVGSKTTNVLADITVSVDDRIEMIIDTKNPNSKITQSDILQALSYAKLVHEIPAICCVVTNGYQTVCKYVFNGRETASIPNLNQIKSEINNTKRLRLNRVEIEQCRHILYTLGNKDLMYESIQSCKKITESQGGIRSDESFREITKLILIKINEEARLADNKVNRFSIEHIKPYLKANDITFYEYIEELFDEAKSSYEGIYPPNSKLRINDNDCLEQLIAELEPYSLTGTDEDIKGAVYEIFLKATLRGDFDQYFTPREIVEFMVQYAGPSQNDSIGDIACGSGGFLIYAFNYVNDEIREQNKEPKLISNLINELVKKNLWGQDIDDDLHILAKINMIMHGDGWNHISKGNSLVKLPSPKKGFDFIITNPPFTTPCYTRSILDKYILGKDKKSEELDILFTEQAINHLKPGGELYIILPEGLLNLKTYQYFRIWLLENSDILLSVSLPEGSFQPFGSSASKTCIIGVRKPNKADEISPSYVYACSAKYVGYETGKKDYKRISVNDLPYFLDYSEELFDGIKETRFGGECGWVKQDKVTTKRIDARYLLNTIDIPNWEEQGIQTATLGEVCSFVRNKIRILPTEIYSYLDAQSIAQDFGNITMLPNKLGINLKQPSYTSFNEGDIIFIGINPQLCRITIAPKIPFTGIMSNEAYVVNWVPNNFIKKENCYCLCSILRLPEVQKQICKLTTGSSSSRARCKIDDLLKNVIIPIPSLEQQSFASMKEKTETDLIHKAIKSFQTNIVNVRQNLLN